MAWRKMKEVDNVLPGVLVEKWPVPPTVTYITISKYPFVAKDRKLGQTGLRTKGKSLLHMTRKSWNEWTVVTDTVFFPSSIHSIRPFWHNPELHSRIYPSSIWLVYFPVNGLRLPSQDINQSACSILPQSWWLVPGWERSPAHQNLGILLGVGCLLHKEGRTGTGSLAVATRMPALEWSREKRWKKANKKPRFLMTPPSTG